MSPKKVMPILVVFAMLVGLLGVAMPVFAAAGDIVVSYTLPSGQITAGTDFSVPVSIAITSVQPITGMQFSLSWDPSKLSLTSATPGNIFSTCSLVNTNFPISPTINNAAGTMTAFGLSGLGIPAGQGCYNTGTGANTTGTTLVTLNFHAVANGKSAEAISGVIFSDVNSHAYPAYTFSNFNLRVGPAPMLAVQSVVFNPANNATSTTATVTIVNNGAAMAVPGDDTVVTLAMSNASPASQTFPVSGLAAGATYQLTQAYTVPAGAMTNLTVTDTVYGLNYPATYTSGVSNIQTTNIDASIAQSQLFISSTTNGSLTWPLTFTSTNFGINHLPGTMNIQSNAQAWTVTVSVDNWNMKEWDSTLNGGLGGYVAVSGAHPYTLHQKLAIAALRGANLVTGDPISSNTTLIPDGNITGQAVDGSGENFAIDYEQTLQGNDPVLAAALTYHAVVTYTDAVSF